MTMPSTPTMTTTTSMRTSEGLFPALLLLFTVTICCQGHHILGSESGKIHNQVRYIVRYIVRYSTYLCTTRLMLMSGVGRGQIFEWVNPNFCLEERLTQKQQQKGTTATAQNENIYQHNPTSLSLSHLYCLSHSILSVTSIILQVQCIMCICFQMEGTTFHIVIPGGTVPPPLPPPSHDNT